MRHRQPEAGSFTGRLGRKERIEDFFPHLDRDAGTVVADADFHNASEVLRGGPEGWFKTGLVVLDLALGRRVDAVRDQVEKRAGDLLWKQFDGAGVRIEGALHRDIELAF